MYRHVHCIYSLLFQPSLGAQFSRSSLSAPCGLPILEHKRASLRNNGQTDQTKPNLNLNLTFTELTDLKQPEPLGRTLLRPDSTQLNSTQLKAMGKFRADTQNIKASNKASWYSFVLFLSFWVAHVTNLLFLQTDSNASCAG